MPYTSSTATAGDFYEVMKTYYLDPLNDNVYRAKVLLSRLEKNSEDVEGNFAFVPLIMGRNPAIGSRKDTTTGPALPEAGKQTYDNATFKMAMHYGRGAVTGPVMRAAKTSAGAFAKALDTEMRGLMERLPEDLNRQAWSYGHGRVATLFGGTTLGSANTAGTTIECNSHAIFSCKVGDRVQFALKADGTTHGGAGTVITGIYRDTAYDCSTASTTKHTITLSVTTGASLTNNVDCLYYGGKSSGAVAGDCGWAQEMYGIPAVVDDGAIGADEGLGSGYGIAAAATEMLDGSLSFGQIDRTSVSMWRAQVMQNPDGAGTNRTLTVALLEEAFLRATYVGGASEGNIEIYTNPGLWATIGLLHIGDRRYNDYKEKIEGGFTAIMFNGRPIFADRDAPRDVIWFLDMSAIMLLTQSGYQFMNEDGTILSRVADKDAYEFALYRDCQVGARRLNTSVKLDDCATVFNVEANV